VWWRGIGNFGIDWKTGWEADTVVVTHKQKIRILVSHVGASRQEIQMSGGDNKGFLKVRGKVTNSMMGQG
jgi:helix-turn-helix protein